MEAETHHITVIDTPGFNDSDGDDRDHINKLCAYLKGCGGINAFVLVRNGTQVRFDMALQRMLTRYHDMFGESFLKRMVIVATHIEFRVAKKQFKQNNQKCITQDICKLFGLNENFEIPVIPIGFEGDHKKSLEALAAAIPADKEEFQHIKSPIDELRNKYKEQQLAENVQFNKLERLKAEIERNQNRLNMR